MSQELKNRIQELLNESSAFNSNDVLVHIDLENRNLFDTEGELTFTESVIPQKILRDAKKTIKQSGINPLCIAKGIVHLSENRNTPILLTPCDIRSNKIDQTISLLPLEDVAFINPYLLRTLQVEFDIVPKDQLLQQLVFEDWQALLTEVGFNVSNTSGIVGNFHHHRYKVIKELEELINQESLSNNLNSLLLGTETPSDVKMCLTPGCLFPADTDQLNVFRSVTNENLVIQGPPGTGKSQVLANILGKALVDGNSSLVLSEKRAALEVLVKRLAEKNLDKLCFIATSELMSKEFLLDLKETWDYFEKLEAKSISNILISKQQEDTLQLTMDLLANEELIGGISYKEFHQLEAIYRNKTDRSFHSDVPLLKEFLEQKTFIQKIYDQSLNVIVGAIRSSIIRNDHLDSIDKKLRSWKQGVEDLSGLLSFETWEEFSRTMKEAADFQIFENDIFKKYKSILKPKSRAQKKFLSLRKKYIKFQHQLNGEDYASHWKLIPTALEVKSLIDDIETGGLLKKLKLKKRWGELSHLNINQAPKALIELREKQTISDSLSHIAIDFCDLGIENPEIDVRVIYQSLTHYTEDKWDYYESLNDDKRSKITGSHDLISTIYKDLNTYFSFEDSTPVKSYLIEFENSLSKLIPMIQDLKKLNDQTLKSIQRNHSINELESELLYSHGVFFKEHFPNFANFEIKSIREKITDIIHSKGTESNLIAQEIEQSVKSRFDEYHELLSTPAYKLSDWQKKMKKRLRSGKSLLVKEFAKTKSHPSLRELFESDAKEWIQALKPIWLSNPAQLANCFPQEERLFDLCIFDEASQIPLQNALGAIHRSTRIAVAGDEHQMGPSSYFKSGTNEVVNLLHQASFYWNKVPLLHHYRSVHPDLIKFSNKHFYKGELKAYPSHNTLTPLEFHHVENGIFTERSNLIEAKYIAKLIGEAITSDIEVGIVAFSEEQLSTIWNKLDAKTQSLLNEKQQDNRAFFKSIENVQGDECDHLIIGFGYGKDPEGNFHMRFGPMNTENGRKRLNVLLTRARKKLDFIASVKSEDFKLSDNESIHLIQQWFTFIENYKPSQDIELPYSDLAYTISDKNIAVSIPHQELSSATELLTFQQVLSSRGWVVDYD